jgi:hypothetical protein
VAATPTINAVMQVGNLEQTVWVEAAAPQIFNLLNHFNWGDPT